jgi:putative hemolysin
VNVLALLADATAGGELSDTLLVIGLVAIPVLVAINGYFVAAEFALVAVRKSRVEELVKQGLPGAKGLMAAVVDLNRSVAACQLGITVASLALGFVSEPAIHRMIQPLMADLPGQWSRALSILLTLSLITYMHVVFGEQMPKLAALQESERVGLWVARPVYVFGWITSPLIKLMNGSSAWFLRRLGYKADGDEAEVHTINELRIIVEDSEEAGQIDSDAADMVLGVFALADKVVRDCMVPVEKMAALDVSTPPNKVLEIVRLGAHTRLPVYDGTVDKIVGIVNTKDLFFLFSTSGVVVLEDALYPATFLDPGESVSNAFRLFRKSHRPMAIVRDEAGKVLGLITLEDVLEEIVGDIEDEHDVPVPKLKLPRRKAPGGHPGGGNPGRSGQHRTLPRAPDPRDKPAGS